jgi:hypothetical protein
MNPSIELIAERPKGLGKNLFRYLNRLLTLDDATSAAFIDVFKQLCTLYGKQKILISLKGRHSLALKIFCILPLKFVKQPIDLEVDKFLFDLSAS